MKISRIDVIGQNGNDGAAYDGFGRDWLAQSGLIAASGADEDRGAEAGLPDPVQAARAGGRGQDGEWQGAAASCAGRCAGCGCGGAEGEGE